MKRKTPKLLHKPAGKAAQSVDETFQLAIRLHQQGQMNQAEKIYRKILRKKPDHVDTNHFLGLLRCQQGNIEQGLYLIRKAVLKSPGYADAHNNLGVILKDQGKTKEAIVAFQACLTHSPDNPDALSNLGSLLREQGDLDGAIDCYKRSIASNPAQTPAYLNLANILVTRESGEAASIIKQWLKHEPDNPVALHMLASCTGENPPPRASDAYVKDTFDRFADKFDATLERLDYRAPQLIGEAVARLYDAPTGSLAILDAGCGTGLCGPYLRPYAKHLTGVDLSGGMVDKARARDVYDGLLVEELTAYLGACGETYDLIVLSDTLIYFGDLRPVFSAARCALKPGGQLVFTLEETRDSDNARNSFSLQKHGRYSHTRAGAKQCLEQSGLLCIATESGVLRTEKDQQVQGLIVTAARK